MLEGAKNRRFEQFVGPHIQAAKADAKNETVPGPERLDIAHLVKVASDLGVSPGSLIVGEFVIRPPSDQSRMRLLGGQHSRQYGVMGTLNAGEIHETCRAANERPAGKDEFRRRLPTSRGDHARAISYPFAPVEGPAHERMGLEALKLVERRERRVLIVEMDHKPDRDEPVAVVIEK